MEVPGVEPKHAALIVSAARVVLVPLSRCPIYLDGQRVHCPVILMDNSLISIGEELFAFRSDKKKKKKNKEKKLDKSKRANALLRPYL